MIFSFILCSALSLRSNIFSDFFVCTTPHPSTIQRTGVFSKWLFSTNKFLYVNTTQNVYEHVKKINFVACGLFLRGEIVVSRDVTPSCSPRVSSVLGGRGTDLWTRSQGITPIPGAFSVSEKKLQTPAPVLGGRVALCVSLC